MPEISVEKNKINIVIVCDNQILHNPKILPDICKEIYIIDSGDIKCSIKKKGKPSFFVRHFLSINTNWNIKHKNDEYHILIINNDEVVEEIYTTGRECL